jgi:uncharacterized protein (DUF1800 family)
MSQNDRTIDPQWAWARYEPSESSPWDRRRAAHLLRRTCFGATYDEVTQAVERSPASVIEQLVEAAIDNSDQATFDQLDAAVVASGNTEPLAAAWLYRMLFSKSPLRESMTLLWHGHFATSDAKVNNARLMLTQNQLLRQHALGSFSELVHGISRDAAMLIYLDSATNRKSRPNENYARELLELFCLGEGHYSEADIREIARCFTGWEVRQDQFRYNRYQHDGSDKEFLGRSGSFDGDAAIGVVLDQAAAPLFVAKKLIRWFVMDEPDPSTDLCQPVANWLVESSWQIAPVLKRLLGSQIFFSEHAIGRKIRSPIELSVGLLRSLEGTTDTKQLANRLQRLGHGLYYPPNVKGWEGGRRWIDSASILGRANLVQELVRGKDTRFAGTTLHNYLGDDISRDPAKLVKRIVELLCAVEVPQFAMQGLLRVAESQADDAERRVTDVITALSALPEFHLG